MNWNLYLSENFPKFKKISKYKKSPNFVEAGDLEFSGNVS